MYFSSSQAIDDYVDKTSYARLSATQETLCFGIVFNKVDVNNQYEYMLRFNVSGYDDPDLPDTADRRVDEVSL